MNINVINNIINSIRKGTFFRIVYKTEVPVKAAYKQMGLKVCKVTSVITRTGINYFNIAGVDAPSNKKNRVNNYEPLVKNVLYYNSNTKNSYLNIYPVKGNYSKTKYEFYIDDQRIKTCSADEINFNSDIFKQRSYSSERPRMQRINIDNIISINGVTE